MILFHNITYSVILILVIQRVWIERVVRQWVVREPSWQVYIGVIRVVPRRVCPVPSVIVYISPVIRIPRIRPFLRPCRVVLVTVFTILTIVKVLIRLTLNISTQKHCKGDAFEHFHITLRVTVGLLRLSYHESPRDHHTLYLRLHVQLDAFMN